MLTNDGLRKMIRAERIKRGWSQEAVAVSLGLYGQPTYSPYETGAKKVTMQILHRLAKLYDVDLHIEFREKQDERVAAMEGK